MAAARVVASHLPDERAAGAAWPEGGRPAISRRAQRERSSTRAAVTARMKTIVRKVFKLMKLRNCHTRARKDAWGARKLRNKAPDSAGAPDELENLALTYRLPCQHSAKSLDRAVLPSIGTAAAGAQRFTAAKRQARPQSLPAAARRRRAPIVGSQPLNSAVPAGRDGRARHRSPRVRHRRKVRRVT